MKKAIKKTVTVLFIWPIGLLTLYSCHDKVSIEDLLFKDKDYAIFICHELSTELSKDDIYLMIRRYPPIAIRTSCYGSAEISSWSINKDTLILNRSKRLQYYPPSYERPDDFLHIEDITDDFSTLSYDGNIKEDDDFSTLSYDGNIKKDSVLLFTNEPLLPDKLLIRSDSLVEYYFIPPDPDWDLFYPDMIPNKDGNYEETLVFKRIDNPYVKTVGKVRTILHEQ